MRAYTCRVCVNISSYSKVRSHVQTAATILDRSQVRFAGSPVHVLLEHLSRLRA